MHADKFEHRGSSSISGESRESQSWCRYLRQYRQITARGYLSFLSILNHVADFVPLGRLYVIPLQYYLKCSWQRDLGLHVVIQLMDPFFLHMQWWERESNLSAGVPLTPQAPQITLLTDASKSGGSSIVREHAFWTLISSGDKMHINCLEMKAIHEAILSFQDLLRGKSVLVHSDNTRVVSHIKRQGGTHSMSLCVLTIQLFELCMSLGIVLQVTFIPGKRNVMADQLSRTSHVQLAEWTLAPNVSRRIQALYPDLQVDLLVTRWNTQLDLFVSPLPDLQAWAVDTLAISWDGMSAYAYPPTNLICQVLNKVIQSDVRLCLVAPMRKAQAWYPTLLSLLVDFPREIPVGRKLLSQIYHTNPGTLNLHIWLLANTSCLRRGFSEKVASRAIISHRPSSRSLYQSRWHRFECWCRGRNVDPYTTTISVIAVFLLFLLKSQKYHLLKSSVM